MKFNKMRLEQFSDGVMSIIVTIMVLNIPLPRSFTFKAVAALLVSVAVYFITFFVVGFFWHQHYRLFHRIEKVSTTVIWRNLLFLFALSLMPVFTKWVIEDLGAVVPAVGYAVVFIFVLLSFQSLFAGAIKSHSGHSLRIPRRFKVLFFTTWAALSAATIVLCFVEPLAASALLIGLPLLFSLNNLWFERPHRRRSRFEALRGWYLEKHMAVSAPAELPQAAEHAETAEPPAPRGGKAEEPAAGNRAR